MFSTSERILDVPNQFEIGTINVSLNAQAEALAQYTLDTAFWLGVVWIIASAARRTVTSVVGAQIARG